MAKPELKAITHLIAGKASIFLFKIDRAELHFNKAIEIDPKLVEAYIEYALLLLLSGRNDEAENILKQLAELADKFPDSEQINLAHANGLVNLINDLGRADKFDIAEDMRNQLSELADKFPDSEQIKLINAISEALYYQKISDQLLDQQKYSESGMHISMAGDAFFKASSFAEGELKISLEINGNISKARSYIRRLPKKKWYQNYLVKLGKIQDIKIIIENLKEASEFYQKASICPIGEILDDCKACSFSINVFSKVLNALDILANDREVTLEFKKKAWDKDLNEALTIYSQKEMKRGINLIKALKELITCTDKMVSYKEKGLPIQGQKLSKCYDSLSEVSYNLDGALGLITDYAIDVIENFSKEKGLPLPKNDKKESGIIKLKKWIFGFVGLIIITIIANLITEYLFSRNILEISLFYAKRIFDVVFM